MKTRRNKYGGKRFTSADRAFMRWIVREVFDGVMKRIDAQLRRAAESGYPNPAASESR